MELFILLLFSSLHFANCLVAISQNYECDDCEFEPYLNHTSCVCGFDGKTYSGPCDAICNGKTEILCNGHCPCSGCHPCCLNRKSPRCVEMMENEAIDCKQCLGSNYYKEHEKGGKKCLLDMILSALFAGFLDNKSHQGIISSAKGTYKTTEATTESLEWSKKSTWTSTWSTTEPTWSSSSSSSSSSPSPTTGDCPSGRNCGKNIAPVCGIDGNTYRNRCYAKCKNGTNVACRGTCPCDTAAAATTTTTTTTWSPSSLESSTTAGGNKCPIGRKCGNNMSPVCGIDGITYINRCKARCENGIPIACRGMCPCRRNCPPTGTECGGKVSPVCGIDGNTYRNRCYARCKNGTNVACRGNCPCESTPSHEWTSTSPMEWSKTSTTPTATATTTYSVDCPNGGNCGKNISPVCGIDGKSYRNQCYAVCKNGIPVQCDGMCPCGGVTTEEPTTPYIPKCPSGNECGKTVSAVCGIDGNNYRNECYAECKSGVQVKCPGLCPCQ